MKHISPTYCRVKCTIPVAKTVLEEHLKVKEGKCPPRHHFWPQTFIQCGTQDSIPVNWRTMAVIHV